MSNAYKDIRAALETTLNTVNLPNNSYIAWENVDEDTDPTIPFIKPTFIPLIREPAVRGNNPQLYYKGLYKVDCYSLVNNGVADADDLADEVLEAFQPTSDVSFNGTIVSIQYSDREFGLEEDGFYQVTINIGWYLYK